MKRILSANSQESDSRGAATRGWHEDKPGYHEKTIMLKKCGSKCFLGTKKSFPICKKNTCKISRQGVYSAYIRSRQFRTKGRKYKNISLKAKKILKNLKK
jgi:hypothetical protein